jgi:hypothetical protein
MSSRREKDEMSDISDMYTDITSLASDEISISSTSDSSSDSDSESTSRVSSVKSSALSGITISTTSTEKERRAELIARQAARTARQATQLTAAELQAAIGDAYDSDSSDDSDSIDTDDISLETDATGMSDVSGLTRLTGITGISAKSMASVRAAKGNVITLNKKSPLPAISKKKTEEEKIEAMAENHELAQELSALGINTTAAHDLLANVDKMNPNAMMNKEELKQKKKEQQQKAKTQAAIAAAQTKKTLEHEMAQEKMTVSDNIDASQFAAADIDAMLKDLEGDGDEIRMPTSIDLDLGDLGLTAQEMQEMNLLMGKQHIADGELVDTKNDHKSSKRKDREEKERFDAMMREMDNI